MESPLNIHGYLPKVKFVLTFDGIFLLEASNHHRYRYSEGGLYERRASPPWRDLAIDYPRSRLGGLENFHHKCTQGGWPS